MNAFLTIFLLVLKISGIVLLAILTLFLLIIFLVLFWPVKYKGDFKYLNKELTLHGSVSWLLLFRILIDKEEKFAIKIKILFFTVYNSHKKKKEKKNKRQESTTINNNELIPEIKSNDNKTNNEYHEQKNIISDDIADNDKTDNITLDQTVSSTESKKISDSDVSKDTNDNIAIDNKDENKNESKTDSKGNKLKNIINLIQSEDFKYSFSKVKYKLINLVKLILPKKWNVDGIIGFDDPSTTGAILAVSSMLYPFFYKHINICGDFENTNICINGKARGRISVVKIIFIVCSLLFDKRIRKIIREFKEV